jgi:hypothetical protein
MGDRSLTSGHAPATVFLLHGLARGPRSLRKMGHALQAAGFEVHNLSYPCRRLSLLALVDLMRARLGTIEPAAGAEPLASSVGHSLGGLVLRAVLADPPPPWRASRLVTIAAPHQGARIAGPLLRRSAMRRFFGPVLADLAWQSAALRALPRQPGVLEIGAIAGRGRFRPLVPAAWINARLGLIANTDGTVELASAYGAPWLPPFQDCIDVDCGHTFIAAHPETVRQTIAFLTRGSFEHGPRRLVHEA